jgi:hypothetical protein
MTTADLLSCVVPVGHLIEQSLALAHLGIVVGVPVIVCGAARVSCCCEHDQ